MSDMEEEKQPQESQANDTEQTGQTGIAQKILEGDSDLTLEDQYNEEFGDLSRAADRMKERLSKARWELKNNEDAATRDELSDVYDTLASDVVALQQELVQLTAAAVGDLFSYVGEVEESEDEEESEGGDAGPDEEDLQIYATLMSNIMTYESMRDSPQAAPELKEQLQPLIDMNRSSAAVFEDQFGDVIKQRWQETLQAAQKPEGDGRQEKESAQSS